MSEENLKEKMAILLQRRYNIMHEIIEDESASIILVTHLEEELEFKVDYVGIMENGKMISFNEVI